MTRRPQNSTLFPYTTLSRSAPLDAPRRHATRLLPPGLRRSTARGSLRRRTADRLAAQGGRLGSVDVRTSERGGKEGSAEVDRKSTRLNSSHDQISYAVFCLK